MLTAYFDSSSKLVSLAARNVTRQRRRALLALATICGGVIAYMLAGGFINWVLESMRDAAIYSQLGHVQVVRPGYLREGQGDPYRYLLPGNTVVMSEAPTGQIRSVAPRLTLTGLIAKGDDTISFLGEGIDPVAERPIAIAIEVAHGQDLENADDKTVILGEGLAANIGAQPGDTVVLLVTTADGGINAAELKVAGLFSSTVKAYDDSTLRLPIVTARLLMRVEGSTSWVTLLRDTDKTQETLQLLRAHLPPDAFELVPWWELADFYTKTVKLFSAQINSVLILIALIVVLSISNTLSMAVMERTSEIGTMMAMGNRRIDVLVLFITEGAILGVLGAVLGTGLGIGLGELISAIGIPMPPAPGMSHGYTGQVSITLEIALNAVMLAFFSTLIASVLPAWKASRMIIVDALRHQR